MMNQVANSLDWGPFAILGLGTFGVIMFAIFLIAVLVLKGYSLWYAAKRDEKWWFIALLVINTAGILELIYLAFIVKKWSKKA